MSERVPSFVTEPCDVWTALQRETRPICLYVMRDGAEKSLRGCKQRSLPIAGMFAWDVFVRGHRFAGFVVKKRADLEQEL